MEFIYYTIAALVLYWISDYILNSIEIRMGKRLPNRSLVFLVIITILSISSFSLIQAVLQKPESTKVTEVNQTTPITKSSVPSPVQNLPPVEENQIQQK